MDTSVAATRRVGDADRLEVLNRLSAAHLLGFLADDEFRERTMQVDHARTAGQLEAITHDLPAGEAVAVPATATVMRDRIGLRAVVVTGLGVAAMSVVVPIYTHTSEVIAYAVAGAMGLSAAPLVRRWDRAAATRSRRR